MKNKTVLSLGHDFKSFIQLRLDQKRPIKIEEGLSFYILACFLLLKYSEDPDFKRLGDLLIRMASEDLIDCDRVNFCNGVTGLGWVIEQLSQNVGGIEVNSDEVLEEIDSLIYKSVLYSDSNSASIDDKFIGALFYFEMRKGAKQKTITHQYKRLSVYISLRMLSERIHNVLNPFLDGLHSMPASDKSSFNAGLLIKIFYFVFSNIGKSILTRPDDQTINKIIEAIVRMERQETFLDRGDQVSNLLTLQFLSLTLVLMGDKLGFNEFRKMGESLYRRLNDRLSCEELTIEEIARVQLVNTFCSILGIKDEGKETYLRRELEGKIAFDFEQHASVNLLLSLLLAEMKDILEVYDLLIGVFVRNNAVPKICIL